MIANTLGARVPASIVSRQDSANGHRLVLERDTTLVDPALLQSLDDVDVDVDLLRELYESLAGIPGLTIAAGIVVVYFLLIEPLLDTIDGDGQEEDGTREIAGDGTGSTATADVGSGSTTERTGTRSPDRSQSSTRSSAPGTPITRSSAPSTSSTSSTRSSAPGTSSTRSSDEAEAGQRSVGAADRTSRSVGSRDLGTAETYELRTSDGTKIAVTVSPVLDAGTDPPTHQGGTVLAELAEVLEQAEGNGVALDATDLREHAEELAEEYEIWIHEVVRV